MMDNYESLKTVFKDAYDQAATGKGKERHAGNEPFEQQQICQISRWLGSVDYDIGQAVKKCLEINRLPTAEAKISELLGAINYIAAAIVVLKEQVKPPEAK
jgi:hypothetical protein